MGGRPKFFSTNPEKAASRVAINGVMLGSIFVMLAVIFFGGILPLLSSLY